MARAGKVILASGIKLDRNYNNVLDYSETQMLNLVESKKVYEANDCSFIRKNRQYLALEVPYGTALRCNYLAFQNPDYSGKWFFGFITEVEYVSNKSTNVYFEIDDFATWYSYWQPSTCFVLREHVNDDTPGLHTVPESLETGEYEIVDLRDSPLWAPDSTSENNWKIVFMVTKFPSGTTNLQENGRIRYDVGYIGGVFSTIHYFAVHTLVAAQAIIKAYEEDSDTTTDAIINIYMVPSCCVISDQNNYSMIGSYPIYPLYNYFKTDNYWLGSPSVLAENYQPVNNKLLTYPYSYFFVTNKCGQTVDYRYEDFPWETRDGFTGRIIEYYKAIVPSVSVAAKLVFTNYKGHEAENTEGSQLYSYGIPYGKIPVCAWTTDYFTNWLTQNGVNVAIKGVTTLATGALGAIGGVATGNPLMVAGSLVGAGSSIASSVGQVLQAQKIPPQAHGDVNAGDFQFCFQRTSISFYMMSIRPEYARIIDNYFSMKGYKVNSVKVPNFTGRQNWNYVQIAESENIGYSTATITVPANSMENINNMFRKGVTIWHNHDNLGNFSLDNAIIQMLITSRHKCRYVKNRALRLYFFIEI